MEVELEIGNVGNVGGVGKVGELQILETLEELQTWGMGELGKLASEFLRALHFFGTFDFKMTRSGIEPGTFPSGFGRLKHS